MSNFNKNCSSNKNSKPAGKPANKTFNKSNKGKNNKGSYIVKDIDPKSNGEAHNNVAWYKRIPTLFETSVRVNPLYNYSKNLSTTVLGGIDDSKYTPSALMSISVVPTIGHVATEKDQINVAFDAMYTYIRHASTVTSNYDAVDLGMYVLAAANLIAAMKWAIRLYAIAQTNMFAGMNPTLPYSAAAAEFLDIADFQTNGAQFVNRFNVFSNKVSSLVVPGSFYYFDKIAEPFTYILTESQIGSIHDQMYMFVPEFFYKLEENTSTHEWYLTPHNINRSQRELTTNDVITYLEGLLTTLFAWRDDVTLMSSDILKAFGSDSVINVPVLQESTFIVPKYDPIVLNQIKNMTCVRPNKGYDIAQDPTHRFLKCELKTNAEKARILEKDAVLTFPEPDLNTDLAFEYSRLKAFTRRVGSTSDFFVYSGAILPLEVNIYELDDFTANFNLWSSHKINALEIGDDIAALSKFAYAPLVIFDCFNEDNVEKLYPCWQIDNLAVIPTANMYNMLDVEYASLFNAGSITELYPTVSRFGNKG